MSFVQLFYYVLKSPQFVLIIDDDEKRLMVFKIPGTKGAQDQWFFTEDGFCWVNLGCVKVVFL